MVMCIAYQNDSTLWISGLPAILKRSTDKGATFTDYDPANVPIVQSLLTKIQFRNNTGYVCGRSDAISNLFLLKYTDSLNTTIPENSLAGFDINIAPNPVINNLIINCSQLNQEITTIEIISLEGLTMFKSVKILQKGKNEILLPLENLKTGIYILKTSNRSGKNFAKFIKQQ
jgi:hypothetical protein